MDNETILLLDKISKHYGKTAAVDGFELELHRGEFVTIAGQSGAGKSTILNMVAGIILPDSGKVFFLGDDITNTPPNKRPFAMVFQNDALFPNMTAKQNMEFPLKRMKGFDKSEIGQKVNEVAELLRISELLGRKRNQLSGGERQRVGLGRALLKVMNETVGIDKALLLMDEPTSSLELNLRKALQGEIKRLQKHFGLTVLYVTHEQSEALSMSDRIALIQNGKLVRVDKPLELYERPLTHYVAKFFGVSNIITGKCRNPGYVRSLHVDGSELHLPFPVDTGRDHVDVLVHPEKLSFAPPHAAQINHLKVRVVDRSYEGSQITLTCRTESGIELLVKQLNNSTQSAPSTMDDAVVYWDVEDSVALSD